MNSVEESNDFLNFLLLFKDTIKADNRVVTERMKFFLNIIDDYEQLKNYPISDKITEIIYQYRQNINKFNEISTNSNSLLKQLNNLINKNCMHKWEHDYIDIDLDRSKKIIYCSECHTTRL